MIELSGDVTNVRDVSPSVGAGGDAAFFPFLRLAFFSFVGAAAAASESSAALLWSNAPGTAVTATSGNETTPAVVEGAAFAP